MSRYIDAEEVMTYTEIAEMLNDLFGDPCPCDFNGIDEWLPFECKFEECTPQPGETRCWEEYLRHRGAKNEQIH